MAMPGRRAGSGVLVLAAALALGAAVAARTMPDASPLRLALTLPALFLVPGYLALQCLFVPERPARARLLHAAVAVGVSPAIVALAALATAVVPEGFRPASIVVMVTAASLGLAGVAYGRRMHVEHAGQTTRIPVRIADSPGGGDPADSEVHPAPAPGDPGRLAASGAGTPAAPRALSGPVDSAPVAPESDVSPPATGRATVR